MTSLALILSAGLLVAIYRDNRRLLALNARTRKRSAQLLRRVRQQRDNYSAALDELWDQHIELRVETDAYREERRAIGERIWS